VSFQANYDAVTRLRKKAGHDLEKSLPEAKGRELMSAKGRARTRARARKIAERVLIQSLKAAEKAGQKHGEEVVKDWAK
jgi:hypothetical protein